MALISPLIAVASGCGESPAAPIDPQAARHLLDEALAAWKGGERHDALMARPEPIRVADEDWLSGARLVSYRVEPGEERRGANLTCGVSLALKTPGGKAVKRRVTYHVGTDPVPMIIRQD